MIQSWKATDDICLQTYSHKPTHTYKHICNSHKPTHRPKIAKEFICFHPKKNYFLKFPILLKFFKTATAQPTQITAKATTDKDYSNSTDRTPAGNSGFAKKRVQWLIEHSTSHQILWYVDNFELGNPLLRKAAKRQTV
jgi:hypothetical protein